MRIFFLAFIASLILFSCKKDLFTTSPDDLLTTTVDTLHFDTVFTTTGSVTQSFKIINDNDKGIRVSSVRLAGGAASPFKINVDGIPGPMVNGVEINANDSAYVFVSVSINPAATNLPFIVRDSIEVTYNGNKIFVQLEAFGQNAHFFRNKTIIANETWTNDLPYVLLGNFIIDTNATLTINKGCRIYLNADAPLVVHGTLMVNGEKNEADKVIFTGNRLDVPYRNFPASWPGIYFSEVSKNSIINHAVIKNAYQAVVASDPSPNANPKITLNETIIENAYDAGILAVNSSITAKNTLVSNCGKNVILAQGGNYLFTHCTIASYSNNYLQHRDPVLFVTNFLTFNNVPVAFNLNAVFRNCIFWGEANGLVENEVVTARNANAGFNVTFDHVLWRVKTAPQNVTIIDSINNQPPQFDSINTSKNFYSFRLKETSPAINKGVATSVFIDLDGNPRPVGLPDLGSYEKQ